MAILELVLGQSMVERGPLSYSLRKDTTECHAFKLKRVFINRNIGTLTICDDVAIIKVEQRGYTMELRLNLDARKRVTLAKFLPNIDIHTVRAYTEGNKIIIEPLAEIPAHELWLYQNPEVLASLQRGIQQAKEGKIRSRGSFAEKGDDEV